jgi:hypothetical protein
MSELIPAIAVMMALSPIGPTNGRQLSELRSIFGAHHTLDGCGSARKFRYPSKSWRLMLDKGFPHSTDAHSSSLSTSRW